MKIPIAEKTVLDNGVIILTEKIPTLRSVAMGIMVGAGSGNETPQILGLSHFLEHMSFKGTSKRSALEIAQAIESVGGRLNAYTGKEYTNYYAVVLDTHLDLAIDVLSDIFLNSLFDPREIEMEKGVILEEIKMYEDTPDELIHDFFAETLLDRHPLGQPTIGRAETVKALNRERILDLRERLYTPDNLIVSLAGNLEHNRVLEQLKPLFSGLKGKRPIEAEVKPEISTKIAIKNKQTEQVHLCLGTRGSSHLDEDRYVFAVMENILGGGMSSRLFQEIREKRGLAYAIFSYNTAFRNLGIFAVYAGTSHGNIEQVLELILKEFRSVKKEGVKKEELERAKEHLKGSLVLGLESSSSRMSWLARSEFYYRKVMTVDEVFGKIDRVSQDDIVRLANTYLRSEDLNLAAIGDFSEKEFPIKEVKC